MEPAPRSNANQEDDDKASEWITVNANELNKKEVTSGKENYLDPRNLATK
jgi:hypothetical protein